MAAVETTAVSPEEIKEQAWKGFVPGNWEKDIDVRDFIQKNYKIGRASCRERV